MGGFPIKYLMHNKLFNGHLDVLSSLALKTRCHSYQNVKKCNLTSILKGSFKHIILLNVETKINNTIEA